MSEEQPSEIRELKRVYERCIETRNFEIQQLIQRNNFFTILQGAIFAGFSQLAIKQEGDWLSIGIAVFGLIVSLFQIGVASGAKFWQEYWEYKLSVIENELKDTLSDKKRFITLFSISDEYSSHEDEAKSLVKRRLEHSNKCYLIKSLITMKFSISTILIYMSFTFLAIWFFICVYTLSKLEIFSSIKSFFNCLL